MVWNRKIKTNGRQIEYAIKKRRGVRSVRLSVYPDGFVSVSAPKWYPLYLIQKFVEEKSGWIEAKIKNLGFSREKDREEYLGLKERARSLVKERVEFFNRYYKFPVGRISIKNNRTSWGSASQKGNLNFNYKIVKLPEDLQDYIVVHELCHLGEMNHSQRFWNLVGKRMPDFKKRRDRLKNIKI
ncbi:MAG: M48 family metallopeptidase [Patescibacteria group bacterium]